MEKMKLRFLCLIFLSTFMLSNGGRPEKKLVDKITENIIVDERPSKEADTKDGRNNMDSLRIISGYTAREHIAPWIISLQRSIRGQFRHMCGGAILSSEWILTAAHCIRNDAPYEIVAGRTDFKKDESATEQRRRVAKTFIHPTYTGPLGPNDIALIQLDYPLTMTSSVSVAKIPKEGTQQDIVGWATLYGWGSIAPAQYVMPNALQTMTVPIVNIETCRQLLSAFAMVTDKAVCTGPITGRPSACVGDSGSPLTKNDVVIGVVSWGVQPCGTPNSAAVYTRVSAFTNWIVETIRKEQKFQAEIEHDNETNSTVV